MKRLKITAEFLEGLNLFTANKIRAFHKWWPKGASITKNHCIEACQSGIAECGGACLVEEVCTAKAFRAWQARCEGYTGNDSWRSPAAAEYDGENLWNALRHGMLKKYQKMLGGKP